MAYQEEEEEEEEETREVNFETAPQGSRQATLNMYS
jgi:hypothetical protein